MRSLSVAPDLLGSWESPFGSCPVGAPIVSALGRHRAPRPRDEPLLGAVLSDEPPMTPEAFKRSIRDLQVWCSSCMVAFSGSDPIGVLIGAEAAFRYAHPQDRGPSRSSAAGPWPSLAHFAQLEAAILGPPIVAEVPETLPRCELFRAAVVLRDRVLTRAVRPDVVGPNFRRPHRRRGSRCGRFPDPRHGRRSPPTVSSKRLIGRLLLGARGRDPHGTEGRR